MKKKFLSLLLAAVMVVSLLPVVRAEGVESIEAQIRDYADSIDQSDAESTAAMTLATHGITGGGKTLKLDATSAIAAMLLNSEVVQVGLADIFSDTMETMQLLDWKSAPKLAVHFNWYGASSDYKSYILMGEAVAPENWDWNQTHVDYSGILNDYDSALEWMAGHCSGTIEIECIRDDGMERAYQVTVKLKDRFDFSTANGSGFKKFLSGVGMLLFKEYDWVCTVSFELTVPCSYDHCTHRYGAYHWTYDDENRTMLAENIGDWLENNTQYRTFTNSKGTTNHYYALDNPIRLDHDRPWVMEYDVRKPGLISFNPVENRITNTQLSIWHTSKSNVYAIRAEYVPSSIVNGVQTYDVADHYYGTRIRTLFDYHSDKLYTFRLENIIDADGSNMIYLTVIDPETGAVCVERVPMDDYYYNALGASEAELISTDSDCLIGKDFHINFFGNQRYGFDADYFDLRIWENGKDGGSGDYFITKTTEPSCTTPGGTTRTCSKCGYSEQLDFIPALGHDFTDWKTVKEASCTDEGRTERECVTCGERESRAIGVIPHSYTPTVTPPTCLEGGFTTYVCVCGDSYVAERVEALGHELTEWEITVAPGCTEAGEEERHCLRCDFAESRVVDAVGHRYEAVVTEPGCTVGGYTDYVCECGESYRTEYTNPIGHRYESVMTAPTCTEQGYTTYTCVCGDTYRSNYTMPVGHSYEAEVTEAGCVEGGYTTYTCECGESYRSNFTTPLGHKLGEWEIEVAATCTEDGCEVQRCARCAYFESRVIEAVGHEWDGASCSRCGMFKENPFADIPAGAWYEEPVLWALEKGITSGATETTFNPNGDCLRAQVVTFLWRAEGCPEPTSTENPFVDVTEKDFYYKAVLWAVEQGITTGSDATHFNPTGICNRAQVVTFVHRAFGSPMVENATNPFTDVPTGTWYEAPILWAVSEGITNGVDATHFGPTQSCNRAQVVTFLFRAYN